MMKELLAIAQRQTRKFFCTKNYIISFVSFPSIVLLIMLLGLDNIIKIPFKVNYTLFLIPGILCIFVVHRSSAAGFKFIIDKNGYFRLLRTAPVNRFIIILGIALGELAIQLVGLSFFLVLVLLYYKMVSPVKLVLIMLYLMLLSLGFLLLSMTVAFIVRSIQIYPVVFSFIMWGVIGSSAAFYPMGNAPPGLKFFVSINPVTYGADALRNLILGFHEANLALGLAVLFAFFIFFLFTSSYLINRQQFQ